MKFIFLLPLALLLSGVAYGQRFEFNSVSGVNSATDDSIDGWSISDTFLGQEFNGYSGELALIFANDEDVPGGIGTPRGTFRGDTGGAYAGKLGLVVFCTDPNTEFKSSSSPSVKFTYEAHSLSSAERRYLTEGVSGYRAGGLLRAAYLIETFYDQAHAAGDLQAASLQSAIWEVLTDGTPSLAPGQGNYFLRNDTGLGVIDLRSDEMIAETNSWFAAAIADDWGGAGYDPGNRVAFWLDPTNVNLNQSVISLNPDTNSLILVPEPSSALLVMLGGVMLAGRRRRLAI
ncbi:PEP-CTERM sorting domain-containing protein [Haloferula sp.]|uniref:PEP-CTERM sorting domain-containing protein n=1 Tax=Haloferula sp. TaxID=2497595 RepID=UPI003C792CB8